jgi:hypothetical protein
MDRVVPRYFNCCKLLSYASFIVLGLLVMDLQHAGATEPPANWRASCFVFRDINRNGIYDIVDRPFAGLLIEIERPDGSVVESSANIDGFANFEMQLNDFVGSAIVQPGVHKAKAFLPAGWVSTTPSSVSQEVTFLAKSDAGSGLVPQQPCAHIGVASRLIVAGTVRATSPQSVRNIEVIARNSQGIAAPVELSEKGFYQFEAQSGIWEITFSDKATGSAITRKVAVRDAGVILSGVAQGLSYADSTMRPVTLVEFDALMTSDAILEIPNGYGGLNWSYWVAANNRFYDGYGYINGTVSGDFIAYNSSGVPATISRAEPFDFLGTYVTAAWPRGETDGNVTVQGWRNGSVVYEDTFRLWNAGGVYFQADYQQVDKVTFSHSVYERIVLDNVSVRLQR